ncbi:hypothetical protein [Streptomyces fagopyri]|uniref:hypothetical protein n=1 Tax=Streptomyces fagopyri TaxID=2662397 RepID=UPI00371862C0
MSEPITTFSGAHPYRPQCVITAATEVFEKVFAKDLHIAIPDLSVRVAEVITTDIDKGLCPRCHDPLYPAMKPEGWKPAGSRALPCRCLPVCETCASWIEPCIGVNPVTAWPTDADLDDDGEETRKEHELVRVAYLKAQAQAAVLEVGPQGPVLVTEDGVMPVQPRPNPGGWLEHGYDDSADQRDRTA